jgi:signal peptidase I
VLATAALAGAPLAAAQAAAPAPGTKVYRMPAGSMEPTIGVGQNFLVALFPRTQSVRPAVGSIVVSHPPRGADAPNDTVDGGGECRVPESMERGSPCPRSTGGRSDEVYVKRIVAGPGDTIAIHRGVVVRNGVAVDEPYIAPSCREAGASPGPCNLPDPIRLPANRYFLMGDNRGESNDSRFWGPVPRAWMVGVVTQIGVPSPTLFR